MISIQDLDSSTAIEAFRRGLKARSHLYYELTRYPCTSFEEVRSRAMAEVRVEEDRTQMPETRETKKDKPERREHPSRNGDYRSHHHPRREQVNYASSNAEGGQKRGQVTYVPLSSYNFCVDEAGMVDSLHALGGSVRWPKKSDRPDEQKDKSKWCSYHNDHGHRTEDCNHLRKEVAWLLF